ncbi:MAG: hypothetical protein FJY77_04150 [Candidatus Altiarchaeales archaeon]|nr:hypothetical protein [Candidatus Altiarchaeales archaeon]
MSDLKELVLKTWSALKNRDADVLREVSGLCSDEAAVSQDEKTIELALITYCFNKLLSKVHYRDKVDKLVDKAIERLNYGDFEGVLKAIDEFDQKYSFFEGSLIEKARVKIASRLYSSGLSMSQSADLLKVRVSNLLEYVGVTKVHNEITTISAMERLKIARAIFR